MHTAQLVIQKFQLSSLIAFDNISFNRLFLNGKESKAQTLNTEVRLALKS